MKLAACLWIPRAMVLALLSSPPQSAAQQKDDASELREVRAAVANALAGPGAKVSFEGLRLVRDNLGAVVCGFANGRRFLAGPAGKPPPQIEGALSAPLFNYLWNARCQGMSASAADEALGRELK